jgi:hypothetical protein
LAAHQLEWVRDGDHAVNARSGLQRLKGRAISARTNGGDNRALSAARNMRLEAAFLHPQDNVLQLFF